MVKVEGIYSCQSQTLNNKCLKNTYLGYKVHNSSYKMITNCNFSKKVSLCQY